jgi:[protein-PII] uridylyltransferase
LNCTKDFKTSRRFNGSTVQPINFSEPFTVSELVTSRIQQAREHLTERRQEIRAMHAAGATGAQVVAALTVLADGIVARLTAAAVDDLDPADAAVFESGMALVALGGYGRAELAPFSDVDLMFLYQPSATAVAERLCNRLVQDLWDANLAPGTCMRTPAECLTMARQDVSIHTALLEARHVVGNPWLTGDLRDSVGRISRGRRGDAFIAAALNERAAEQAKSGSNVHLLEPDLKRSKGGLRELHLQRWVAHVRFGVAGIDRLERDGHLSADDAAVLSEAREFLLRLRNEVHFHAGRAQDTLHFGEQARLAPLFGYQDRPGMLAVEQFMQQYYRHSTAIDDVTDRFVRRCQTPSVWRRLVRRLTAKRLHDEFIVTAADIAPAPEALASVLGGVERITQLFALANKKGVPVADTVREQIRTAAPKLNGDVPLARRTFLDLLAEPGHLEQTLHHMHSLGVLEKLIPEFEHARGLIQFNQYHKYTVDAHTLICVGTAEKFLDDRGPFGQVYRDIHHKEILHLALLLHDLGKGFERDHSELGAEIAERTAERFALEPHLRDLLVFLVYRHLLMAHLAFRRDTSDEQLLDRFARQVGTPELLKMLFVLTAADITSVGPDTWTTWKSEVLCDLFARTMEKLSGQAPTMHAVERMAEVREQVARALHGHVPEVWLDQHLAAMTQSYLLTTPADRIGEHLRAIHQLPAGDVTTVGSYEPATQITAYTVYTFDNITPGLFSKIAGVLAAKGLQILSAQIATFKDGVVVDRFEVLDYDHDGEPPQMRLTDVGTTTSQVLRGKRSIDSVFAQSTRIGPRFQARPSAMEEATQVKIDNDTSDNATIIEVFTNDRQGLLYVITRTIFQLGLSVSVAKIATSLDQVLDVFYVTDQSGRKVTDEALLQQIRNRLVHEIEAFSSPSPAASAG